MDNIVKIAEENTMKVKDSRKALNHNPNKKAMQGNIGYHHKREIWTQEEEAIFFAKIPEVSSYHHLSHFFKNLVIHTRFLNIPYF